MVHGSGVRVQGVVRVPISLKPLAVTQQPRGPDYRLPTTDYLYRYKHIKEI